ncbi:MAG: dipeptidase [Microscillaceae bacterium]|nr:dipeptidase [Microscillaceae bacterium]
MTVNNYLHTHRERFIEELLTLLKIPSVSTDNNFREDIHRAAAFIQEKLKEAGVPYTEIIETSGYPIVFGEKIIDASLPTVLVYGHYDVQPPDPLDLWNSPPFEPVIQDGKIYARGSSDDKGQMYMHIKAIETLIAQDALPCNVKFMIEGEEEIGSPNLAPFVKANKDKLGADVILISDTSILDNDIPSITAGLRGLCYMEVEVTGPNRDLHSGVYGGGVANPINILCQMISSLKDEQNQVTIPGFYDQVLELSDQERALIAQIPFDEQKYKDELGIDALVGENGYSTLERTSTRPTLDVNGIWGGYIGEGAKTVLPSKAYAKISMRLVPNQSSEEITRLFTEHFQKIAPAGVRVKVAPHHGGEPAVTPIDSIAFRAATQAFEEVWGKTPIPKREGGSIPIVSLFERELGLKSVLMGFGLDSDNIHSPNEHFGLFNYFKGIETISAFYKHFAALQKS